MVASLRVVAGENEEVLDAERGGAHQLALQRDAILVAAGELQHRLDAGVEEKARRGERRHMGAGAGAVGDIHRVGQAFERQGLAHEFLPVERHRRRDFRRHDEASVRPVLA